MFRTDTGNFNRFLTSIGLLMVAGALVIPYFYFRDTDSLLVSRSELRALTPTAREALETRQGRVADFEGPILGLVALLAIGGVASMVLGGRRLRIAQGKEDAAVDRRAQREGYEIQQLSKDEVEEKRDEQAREVVRDGPDEPKEDGEVSSGDGPGIPGRPGESRQRAPAAPVEAEYRGSGFASGISTRLTRTRAEIARIEERAGAILREGAGDSYPYLSDVKIVSGRRRVSIDGLVKAKKENRPDVLIELKVVMALRGLRGRARMYTDEMLALLARYEDVTGRGGLAWLILVVPENSEGEPTVPLRQLEEEFTDMLVGLGRCSVVEERELDLLPERLREILGS